MPKPHTEGFLDRVNEALLIETVDSVIEERLGKGGRREDLTARHGRVRSGPGAPSA